MPRTDVNLFWLRPGEQSCHRGHAVLITDIEGNIRSGVEGFYFRRTRFLSRMAMRVDGSEPHFVSANPVEPHMLISYHLAASQAGAKAGPNPESGSGGEIADKGIEIQMNRFVGGGMHLDVHVTNHALAPTSVTLAWELAADFADQAEARTGKRQQTAPVQPEWQPGAEGGALRFRYLHPDLPHMTELRFAGPGQFSEGLGTVTCTTELAPRETRTLLLDVAMTFMGERIEPFYGLDGSIADGCAADRVRAEWDAGCTRLHAANPRVDMAWARAAADLGSLHMLEGQEAERYTPVAGIPSYTGLFGRDALMTSLQSVLLNPATLHGTLELLGRTMATSYDDAFDAEPGKFVHQAQRSPLALLGKTPYLHYYGDYSAPGLYLLGLASEFAQTADAAFFHAMQDKTLAALAWMDRDGDRDHDGFYEYETRAGERGIKNQGWKDSGQAILYADGRMVQNPIAVSEVQGLYYAGKRAVALAFIATGERARGEELLGQADELKRRFNERFWLAEEQFFALALDPDKEPVRSIASDAGACLAYGIVDTDKAGAVVDRLLAPDMFSGWGIRSLSSAHPAYNPFAYHLGTVWPFANALTAFGMKRYGFAQAQHRVAAALFDATQLFHLDRLPEVFGGHARDRRHPHPGIYPGACAPQAWSASAIVLLIHGMLGLVPLAPLHTLIVDPDLPDWLPEVRLENLRIGMGRADLRFWRTSSGTTEHEVLRAPDGLRVCRPSLPAGCCDRIEAAIQTALA